MADRKQPIKTASRKHGSDKTRHFPHLKPLSAYSRMVFYKATNSCSVSPSWSPNPNPNLDLSNSRTAVGRKRRLDDSCLDETYDTPPKKPCFAKHPSPASAYVLDSFDAFRQVKLVSPQSSSVILEEIKRVEQPLSHQKPLGQGWIEGNDKPDGQSSVSVTDVHSSSPVIVRSEDSADVIAFDYDVDEIMCLSPIDSADVSADGLEDFIQSPQIYYEEQLPAEEGHSWRCSSRQKQGKWECLLDKDAQAGSDEGYVTKSYYSADPGESKVTAESEITKSDEMYFIKSYKITIPNLSNDKTPPVSTPIMSTPSDKFRELVKRAPILSPKLDLEKESWSSPTVIRESVKASSATSLSANANLDSANTEAFLTIPFLNVSKSKEGNIVHEGTSIRKSLVCQVKENEDVLLVSQQQSDSEIQVTFREETDAADSFKNTLPLQVQVILPNTQQPEAVKATARKQPEKKASSEGQRNVFKDAPRPVVLYREEDWEKEKKVYVDSVIRHMTDNVEDGVMNELLQLMSTIANQGRRHDGRTWHHPSDLTRRNYRLRNSSRLLSLDEWQNQSYRNYRRFAKVPQMFKRSRVL
ncbi:hypothetical protein PDJAM_G00190760 [Pangasius djambal]|uniref:Uncharacterized protein n=1 Tax=Pangasius djambal TaxID=1691987 RepID=A0ACC5Y5U9_9TELE|nr:hypothetical protein [Pangasius djambal]